jgi:hypothetical protein
MAITAGIGSDHVDLAAAVKHKVDVVEVTGSNSISVAEHEVGLTKWGDSGRVFVTPMTTHIHTNR